MSSLIENINAVREKLDVIVAANSIFDEGVVPILTEIAALDLDQAVLDLKKGTFLGNRKLDIDLALNKIGIESTNAVVDNLAVWNTTATTVYYSYATVTFVDGVSITVNFVNDDLQPIVISNHGSLVAQLLTNVAFTTKLTNTGIFDDVGGATGNLLRVYDIVGASSNIERIQLNAVGGTYKVQNPIYYWGLTTSSFQTLAMRASDIIKLGNDIDSIILLATRIDEMLALQAQLPALVTNIDSLYANIAKLVILHTNIAAVANIHTNMTALLNVNSNMANITDVVTTIIPNIAEILLADTKAATATAKALEAFNSAAAAALSATTATTQAGIATAKANSILGLTTQTSTGAAGSLATVSYNPVDGKMTFSIPQGIKGDRGDAFTVNSVGLAADRSLYDAQIKGFSFLAIDVGMVYFKLSATSADWSIGSPFGKGDKGDVGLTGVGIDHVSFFSTTDVSGFAGHAGATDTYRITNTDATTYDFIVYNGLNGVLIDDVTLSLIATWSNQKISDELAQKANQASTYTKTEIDTALGLKFDKLGGSLGGALNEARATVASHATTANIWGALGNQIDFTGTATVTAFPNALQAGATRELICAGACSFTASANMLIDGVTSGNTVTCSANDTVIVRAISTTQFKLSITKYAGMQEKLVSGVNIATVNGVDLTVGGDIQIGAFGTGDVVVSSDMAKYTSPEWLKCDDSYYDKTAYPLLHDKLGYTNGTSSQVVQEVVTCKPMMERFSNYYAMFPNSFGYGEPVAFNSDESVAVVYHNTVDVRVYRLDIGTNKYVLVTTITSPTSITSASISSSGNLIAFTAGNSGYVFKYNGTTYTQTSSVSNAAYTHTVSAINDTDTYVVFSNITSGTAKIYPLTNGVLGTGFTNGSLATAANCRPEWLLNQNILVFASSSLTMVSVSAGVATTIGSSITTLANAGNIAISLDGLYTFARFTTAPYFRIYKNSATLGPTLIYSDALTSTDFNIIVDGDRICRYDLTTNPIPNVYILNRATDTVTKSTTAFDSPIIAFISALQNGSRSSWRAPSLSGYTLDSSYNMNYIPMFKWDSATSKYKMWCSSPFNTIDINYNPTREYAIFRTTGSDYTAYLVQIDQTTFEPIPSSIKFIQYPSILNSSTVSNNYFSACEDMFVCIQYGNPIIYKLNKVAYTFSAVTTPLSLLDANTGYSKVSISPTGEFIAKYDTNNATFLYGAYKDAGGSYVATTALTNSNSFQYFGDWYNNSSVFMEDSGTTGVYRANFTSLSPTVTSIDSTFGGKTVYTQVMAIPNGVVIFNDSLFDYYAYYPNGTLELLLLDTAARGLYVSDDGRLVIIGTTGFMYNATLLKYVKIGDVVLYGISTSWDTSNTSKQLFDYTKGIINTYSANRTTMLNKVPAFTFSTTLAESTPKAYIKTGVIV